jgi:ankyrin repeat protein
MGNAPSVAYADRELASAAEKGNLQRVKFLIEKDGANVNFQDAYGWSPVLHAISEGHLEYVSFRLF